MATFTISYIYRLLWRPQAHALVGMLLGIFTAILVSSDAISINNILQLPSILAWGLLVTIVGFSFATGLGYFSVFRTNPRKSDLLLLLVAIPTAALVVTLFQRWLLNLALLRYSTAVFCGAFSALSAFLCHYVGSGLRSYFGPKRRIVVDALQSEKERLQKVLSALGMTSSLKILSKYELKEHILRNAQNSIDLIIISKQSVKHFEEEGVLIRAHLSGIPIIDIKTLMTDLTGRVGLEDSDLWSYVLGATPQTPMLRFFSAIKTFFEPVLAFCIGLVFLPIIAMLAIAIKYTSKGPILYKQVRTGYMGRNFTLIKFRSMSNDAEANGPQWASSNDSRVTKIGNFMRRTRLDELPQLWNVIRGEMSFVGPRPERPEIYRELKKSIPLFSMRTIVRPGITGWAQVLGGYAASISESLAKLEYDLYYIQNMSPRLEIIILLKTIQVAIFGDKPKVIELPELVVVTEEELYDIHEESEIRSEPVNTVASL